MFPFMIDSIYPLSTTIICILYIYVIIRQPVTPINVAGEKLQILFGPEEGHRLKKIQFFDSKRQFHKKIKIFVYLPFRGVFIISVPVGMTEIVTGLDPTQKLLCFLGPNRESLLQFWVFWVFWVENPRTRKIRVFKIPTQNMGPEHAKLPICRG